MKKYLLPIAIIAGAVLISGLLVFTGPEVEVVENNRRMPDVQVTAAQLREVNIPVFSRGSVTPRVQVQLASVVSGEVIEVSDNFVDGGFFKKDDVLLKIADSQYKLEVSKAKASRAQALQNLKQAQAQYKSKNRSGLSDFAKGTYLLEEARANYAAAENSLEVAEEKLAKTEVKAPFDGRIKAKSVDIGDLVNQGKPIAEIYAIDSVEIRLPLSDAQLQMIDVPQYANSAEGEGARVVVQDVSGNNRWYGRVARTTGSVDTRNRLKYLVVKVDDPYLRDEQQPNRPPLAPGEFVSSTVEGKKYQDIVVLPREALHDGEVWVVNEEGRLQLRPVDVLYRGKEQVFISNGLEQGEQVIYTPLDIVVDGMQVNVIADPLLQESVQ